MHQDLDSEKAPFLGSLVSRWRSTRQMHRIMLLLFIGFAGTIFILERYRDELSAKLTLLDRTKNQGSGSSVPPYEEYYHHYVNQTKPDDHPPTADDYDESLRRAGNATLGFHAIYYMNMKLRWDREDAMAIQSYISGLNITDFPAVEADQLDPAGLPPTQRPGKIRQGEKGCWRAHANIWSEMVRKKLPPVLIFESDATFDINLRPVMANLNKHFVEFLKKIESKPVHDPSYDSPYNRQTAGAAAAAAAAAPIQPRVDDPWLSEHWDLFSLGHCFENDQDHKTHLVFPDPSVPGGNDYFGRGLERERVVRKSGGIVCTTSYAISHTGAAKLLLRSAIDLDNPVDLLIRRLTLSRDLVAYSVHPPVIVQWGYKGGLGMDERGAQSDVHSGGMHKDTPEDAKMDGWDDVKGSNSVWRSKANPGETGFEKMCLNAAWERVMGPDSKVSNSMWDEKAGNK